MAAVVRVKITHEGEPATERVQLLGGNIESFRRDGLLTYEIPARLRKIIKNSTIFARLQREIMFALSSKYSLTLYEMVQKRGNLKFRSTERFSLEEMRGILGVPKGKLGSWSNLKLRAIDPAVEEVSSLSDYLVEIQPQKTGRRVTHVELKWWRKDASGVKATEREMTFSKVGRKARAKGLAENVEVGRGTVRARPVTLDKRAAALRTETYETARLRYPGYDIYYVESEWIAWASGKSPANDPDRAYLAFFGKFAERNPL